MKRSVSVVTCTQNKTSLKKHRIHLEDNQHSMSASSQLSERIEGAESFISTLSSLFHK